MTNSKKLGRKKITPYEKRLTTGEVAAMTGLSADYIRMCADKKDGIPHIRIRKYRWFKREDILAWLDKMKQNAEQEEVK